MTKRQTLADMCAELNALRAQTGGKSVKKLTCSATEAIAKIAAERAKLPQPKPAKAKSNGARITIKSIAVPMIVAGDATDAIIAAIKSQFPDAAFNAAHISWYKSALKSGRVSA